VIAAAGWTGGVNSLSGMEAAISRGFAAVVRNTPFFLNLSYICPEPV
jgi:hypothetical protein